MSESKTTKFLEERLESNPKSLLFAILADIYLQQGRLEDAVVLCSQGVKYNPDYITGKYVLAKAYSMQGENEKAEEQLKQVLTHDRHYLSAHKMMADIMIRMGWENSAVMHYKEILRIDPQCEEVREAMNALSISDEALMEEELAPRKTKLKSEPRKTYISAPSKREVENLDDDSWLDQLDESFPADAEQSTTDSDTKAHESNPSEIILDPFLEETISNIDNITQDTTDEPPAQQSKTEESTQPGTLSEDTPLGDLNNIDMPQGLSAEELERALDELLDTSDISEDSIKQELPQKEKTENIQDGKTDESVPEISMDDDLDKIFSSEADEEIDSETTESTEPQLDNDDFDLDELGAALDDIMTDDHEEPTPETKNETILPEIPDLDVELEKETQNIKDIDVEDSLDSDFPGVDEVFIEEPKLESHESAPLFVEKESDDDNEQPIPTENKSEEDISSNIPSDETQPEADDDLTEEPVEEPKLEQEVDHQDAESDATEEPVQIESNEQPETNENVLDIPEIQDVVQETESSVEPDDDSNEELPEPDTIEPVPEESDTAEPIASQQAAKKDDSEELNVDEILENIMSNQDVMSEDDDSFDSDSETEEPTQDISSDALENNPLFNEAAESQSKTDIPEEEELPPLPDLPEDFLAGGNAHSDSFDLVPPPPSTDQEMKSVEQKQPADKPQGNELKESKLVSPTLGEIYAAQGEYTKAIKVYQTLLDKNPNDPSYQDKIKELQRKIEDKKTEE